MESTPEKPTIHVGIKLTGPEHIRLGVLAAEEGTSRAAIARREVVKFLSSQTTTNQPTPCNS